MKLTTIILISTLMQVYAKGYSQISLNEKNVSLIHVLKRITKQSGYNFIYNQKSLKDAREVSLQLQNVTIEEALKECFTGQPFTYEIVMKTVVVKARAGLVSSDIRVSGNVTDTKGEPLAGVSVKVMGSIKGVVTDVAGNYVINTPEDGLLIFSYVGFTPQEIPVNNRTEINVRLQAANQALNEVVVTALGIERQKKTLTYSTQSVGTKELTQSRELNVVNALQGKVAGLNIGSGSSGVGAMARVILRGNRSISGNSQPLYVIDGVPVRGNPSDINPDNISAINILKGANASALYGSAGQNGVIVIETKKGRQGVANVSLSTTYMLQQAVQSIPFQYQYGQGAGDTYDKSSEDSWGPALDGRAVQTWSENPVRKGTNYSFLPQQNVREDMFQTGHNSATNLSVTMGGEKTQTAFGYTYTDAAGIVPNNALQRHNLSVRMTNQLSGKFSLDSKLDYAKQNIDNILSEGESSFNPVRHIYTMPPNIRMEDLSEFEYIDAATGINRQDYWAYGSVTSANPYWAIKRNLKYNKSDRIIAMTALTYKISDGFKALLRGSYDGESAGNEEKSYNGTFRDPQGRYLVAEGRSQQVNADFLLSYDKQVNGNWSVQANMGGEVRHLSSTTVSSATNSGLNVPNLFTLSNSGTILSSNALSAMQTQSLYSNAQLGYKGALYLDASARNDWSSTLAAGNRSFFYPSLGLSAVVSELAALPSAVSYLKIRASWAQVGNGTSPYQLQRFATSLPGGSLGYLILNATMPNAEIKPEKTTSTELGIETSFLENRFRVDLTLYQTNTSNQIFAQALPVGSGAASFLTNGGDVQNRGLEAIFGLTAIKKRNFSWDIDINYAANRNTVKALANGMSRLVVGSDSYMREFVLEEGKPFGLIYGKGFQRDAQGNVIVEGRPNLPTTGLPLLTAGRTVLLGNINPDWTAGFSNSISFKNLTASFLITHKQGGMVASFTDAILYGSGLVEQTIQGREGGLIFGQNTFTNYTAVKSTDGTANDIPVKAESLWRGMGARTAPVGEAFTRSATNTRLRELNIGYRLPKSMYRKMPVSSIEFALVGRNLFFLYRKDSNIDPDFMEGTSTISEGFQSFAPPTTRSFGANLRFNF